MYRRLLTAGILSTIGFVTMTTKALKFPTTLDGFGYQFDRYGRLRQVDQKTGTITDRPFEYDVSPNPAENQKRYEVLGEVINEFVYGLLEDHIGLQRLPVPKDSGENGSFIFASPDAFTNPDKLLILIHGSGVVRAGQWARSLIINDSLRTGTQIPFIERAMDEGYAVLVLNSNFNERRINGKLSGIKGSESPEEHVCTVWKEYVLGNVKAKRIFIVAHSYGGVTTLTLAHRHFRSFEERVIAVAMTDSVHDLRLTPISLDAKNLLKQVSRNWVASDEPLDQPVRRIGKQDDIPEVSAGHPKHEMTSSSSINSIFRFFSEKLSDVINKQEF